MSVVTDAIGGASIGSARTLLSAIQDSALEGPAPKKPKETKLDKLKAQQRADAPLLKETIELELELVKDKYVAKEPVLKSYCSLLNNILGGMTLDETLSRWSNSPLQITLWKRVSYSRSWIYVYYPVAHGRHV